MEKLRNFYFSLKVKSNPLFWRGHGLELASGAYQTLFIVIQWLVLNGSTILEPIALTDFRFDARFSRKKEFMGFTHIFKCGFEKLES